MKRAFPLMIAVILIFSLCGISFAENEVTAYSWSDAEPLIEQFFEEDGNTWTVEEVNAVLWLPSFFSPVELTPEDIADGTIGFYSTDNGSQYVLLNYADSDGLTLESFFLYFQQNGADIYRISVNDIPAIYLRDHEKNSCVLIYQTQEGKFFQVIFSPLAAEEMFKYSVISIRPRPEDSETSTEPAEPVNPVSSLISK